MKLSTISLQQHLKTRGFDYNAPLLASFDCDRTLVNRKQGAHFISPLTKELYQKLKNKKEIISIINTGRDWTAYQPLLPALGSPSIALFLSGRVLLSKGMLSPLPFAALSKSTVKAIYSFTKRYELPFLDAQFSFGNIIWKKSGISADFFKPFKPIDWLNPLKIEIRSLEELNLSELLSSKLIRAEIPIFVNSNKELYNIIKTKNIVQLRKYMKSFFLIEELEILPILSRPSLLEPIVTLRIMTSNKKINKGIGLKHLVENLGIPHQNVIMIGDSNDPTASDCVIKKYLPQSTLCLISKTQSQAVDFRLDLNKEKGIQDFLRALINV